MLRHLFILPIIFSPFIGLNAQHQISDSAPQLKRIASHTVISIGNVADIEHVQEYATALASVLDTLDYNHTIIFNGDFTSLPAYDPQAFSSLDTLIRLLRSPQHRKLIFIPGDRDWADSQLDGWENVVAIEEHISAMQFEDVIWPLSSGCPGPERISLDLTLNLIAINTQWWNHPHTKPSPATATCLFADEESVLAQVEEEIEDASYGNLIIAGHFPIVSHGMYGGSFPWYKWIFPVPVVNTSITAYRQNVGSSTEITNENFEDFREEMKDLFLEYNSMIYLSGHEYNREVIKYGDNILISSGAPEKGKFVKRVKETVFASNDPGIVLTHFDVEGNAWITSYGYMDSKFEFEESSLLLQAPCKDPEEGIAVNERLVPCLQNAYVLTEMSDVHPDEMNVVANDAYGHGGFVNFFFGKHYRDSWSTPVSVPVLNLDLVNSGLVPYAIGGGEHTRTLKFAGGDGYAYVFRSVVKDAAGGLSFDLRHTLLSLAVRDQTSTQYPFGALVTSVLLDSLDILHPRPALYVLPEDGKLGPFREDYGSMLGMLEDYPTGNKVIRQTFSDADEIKNSVNMFRSLYTSKNNRVDVGNYARARAFDLLVGDWDRSEDNWKWAGLGQAGEVRYKPIPIDRDNVFSRWDGILPWIADREWAKTSGEDFDHDLKDIRSLTYKARHLDRFIANELTRQDWLDAASAVQEKMTDQLIDSAMARLPQGVIESEVTEIADKLRSRRNQLDNFTGRLYDLIAKEVDVIGSIESELFEVTRMTDGKVRVEMFSFVDNEKGSKYYSRIFDPAETNEIRLFGLLGDDRFEVTGEVNESILVRIIPGLGSNVVEDRSLVVKGKELTLVYSKSDKNLIFGGDEMKEIKIPFDDAYRYDRTSFKYNTYTPSGYLYYTSDNGLLFGAGVNFIQQNYNKPDFSSMHEFTIRVSTLGNLRLGYEGTIRHVLGQWDLTLAARGSDARRFNYFFGLGNETEYNADSLANGYYTLQYSNVTGLVGLKRSFWKRSAFEFSVELSSFGPESGENNILDGDWPPELGGDSLRIARVNWSLEFDLRDRKYLPTSGVRIIAEGFFANRLNQDGAYSLIKGSVEWHGTARPFTFGLSAGGWFHHQLPPFYDLEYLGHNTYLRGFRRNRFAGDKGGAYFNSDVRIKIFDNPNAIIPYRIGLLLFYDVGRVFQNEENSNVWHTGYGFGIYAVPFRERFVIGLSLGFSVEETAFLQFGFGKLF